jgi:NitT/TauT family transport system ATP-binding protein
MSATATSTPAHDGVQISIRSVSKTFQQHGKDVPVLADIDVDLRDQEFVSVIGTSGTGKTTLLNIVAGITPADQGEVVVDGKAVTGPSPERGVIFQAYEVFPWLSVRNNIGFGLTLARGKKNKAEREAIVNHYIQLMGLTGFEDAWPKQLSGGMKQRVAIARAYAVNPKILLMDEPFGALDAQTRDQMQVVLQNLMAHEKKTVLFVTHSVEEALFLSNRVVVLSGRPARVREILDVPWPLPRDGSVKLTPEFAEIRRRLEELLHGEANGARSAPPEPMPDAAGQ